MAKRNFSTERLGSDNTGVRLLFAEAGARVEMILDLIDEFNGIRDALENLGYVGELYANEIFPLPILGLMGNGNSCVRSAEFLEESFERGPDAVAAKISRIPLLAERHRLGAETGWTCHYCRAIGDKDKGPDGRVWHIDHAYPISKGGDDQPDNHVLACATCNLGKRARTANEFFAGLVSQPRRSRSA